MSFFTSLCSLDVPLFEKYGAKCFLKVFFFSLSLSLCSDVTASKMNELSLG